jgi:glycosyltransferase involved in cell wall biosynthesis
VADPGAGDPRVAVVIPVRDGAELVLDAVESARAQGPVVTELVAVDNGSRDATVSVLERAGVRVLHEPIAGAGAARRRGLDATTAPYVMFLDHDDVLVAGALAELARTIERTAADLVHGAAVNQVIGAAAGAVNAHHVGAALAAPLSSTSLVDRTAFTRFGPMDDDNFSWPRWALAAQRAGARIIGVGLTVCTRRIHGGNVSLQEGSKRGLFALIREHRAALDGGDG